MHPWDKADVDYLMRFDRPYVFPAETRRDKALYTNPHWTDERFTKQDQIVFGTDNVTPHTKIDYADRLRQWDYAKSEAAYEVANTSGKVKKSAQWYEAYLSAYFGKPMHLDGLVVGINRSDGYATQCFYYHEVE